MELSMKKASVNNYILLEKLGEGYSCKVYLCYHKNNPKIKFAIKIFKENIRKYEIENEITLNQSINHKKIIKIIDSGYDLLIRKNNNKMVNFIVFEVANSGEIFEYLMIKNFPPSIAIHYFKELLYLLKYFKKISFYHRDLKPENLLLDQNFNLKVIDLGFSRYNKNDQKLNSFLGTENYSAPEILDKKLYDGFKSDLFSAGIIFFVMYTGNPPFIKASKTCKYYKMIFDKEYDKFWEVHEKLNKKINFTPEIKFFFEKMFEYDPENRLEIDEILNLKFIKSNNIRNENLINYLSLVRELISYKNKNFIFNTFEPKVLVRHSSNI